jgi:hypothetical protein
MRSYRGWRAERLVVAAMGYRVLRFTWRQVVYEPGFVARAITAALHG